MERNVQKSAEDRNRTRAAWQVGPNESLQATATTEAFSELVAPRFGGRS